MVMNLAYKNNFTQHFHSINENINTDDDLYSWRQTKQAGQLHFYVAGDAGKNTL